MADVFRSEVEIVSKILPDVGKGVIAKLLEKYSAMPSYERIQFVLKDRLFPDLYIAPYELEKINKEAYTIQDIFPYSTLDVLINKLKFHVHNPNRLQIVIKDILTQTLDYEKDGPGIECDNNEVLANDSSVGSINELNAAGENDQAAGSGAATFTVMNTENSNQQLPFDMNLSDIYEESYNEEESAFRDTLYLFKYLKRKSAENESTNDDVKFKIPKVDVDDDDIEVIPVKEEIIDLTSSAKFEKYITFPSTSADNSYNIPDHFLGNEVEKEELAIPVTSIPSTSTTTCTTIPSTSTATYTNSRKEKRKRKMAKASEGLYYHIMEIFSDADTTFLKELCANKPNNQETINQLIDEILTNHPNYPKRVLPQTTEPENGPIDIDVQFDILKQVLPDADPAYLLNVLERLPNIDELKVFTIRALENRDYPKLKDVQQKEMKNAQAKQYTTDFDVKKFLELIPDPETYFNDPNLKSANIVGSNRYDIQNFFKNRYSRYAVNDICRIVYKFNNIMSAVAYLDNPDSNIHVIRSVRRTKYPIAVDNIPLLQIFAFINHRSEINAYLEQKKQDDQIARQTAKQKGELQTCCCCFDDELLVSEVIQCDNGCISCKTCVQRNVEILFGESKLNYDCLNNCGGAISLQMLQTSINPKLFSRIAQKKQMEEVKAAGIEELESCPFCDFASIPVAGDKIFKCFNPECMKESCRECKEPSHIPLRCDEVEKDEDVKKRTELENKMTEALLRKCYKCGLKFIKSDGCNKMSCSCGAKMCYICNQPVTDYKHFNGQGGDRLDLCPLYSDTNEFHKNQVMKVVNEAQPEIRNSGMKVDPTQNIDKYFQDFNRRNPAPTLPGVQMPANAALVNAVIRLQPVNNFLNYLQ